ncbi:MAG: CBS domain-containing protein [Deltaproteobacteria bacterium]
MSITAKRLKPNDTLLDALGAFAVDFASELPVVDSDGRVLGGLGADALMRAIQSDEGKEHDADWLLSVKVGGVLRQECLTIGPEASFSEAAKCLMSAWPQSRTVMVVDNEKRLLGVISEKDFLRGFYKYAGTV